MFRHDAQIDQHLDEILYVLKVVRVLADQLLEFLTRFFGCGECLFRKAAFGVNSGQVVVSTG